MGRPLRVGTVLGLGQDRLLDRVPQDHHFRVFVTLFSIGFHNDHAIYQYALHAQRMAE